MIKINWYFVYFAAVCIDITEALLMYFAVGVVVDRIFTIFVTMCFAFYFWVTGIKGWMFPLFGLSTAEEVPFIGDFLAALPIEWVIMVWRIHRKNRAPTKVDQLLNVAQQLEGKAGEGGESNNKPGSGGESTQTGVSELTPALQTQNT